MSDAALVPNHHADYRQFGGIFGYLAGLTMILGRGRDARLVADMSDVDGDDHVLDIGCGPGVAAREAANRGARVTGIDPSPPMLAMARLLTRIRPVSGSVSWAESTAEQIDLPTDAVTVCWSIASVHHWKDLVRALDEVRRVLRVGGRFLAVEKRTEPGAKGNAGHGWTPDQAAQFAAMLTDLGFDDVKISEHEVGGRNVVVVAGTNGQGGAADGG